MISLKLQNKRNGVGQDTWIKRKIYENGVQKITSIEGEHWKEDNNIAEFAGKTCQELDLWNLSKKELGKGLYPARD